MTTRLTDQSERKSESEFDPTPSLCYGYILKKKDSSELYYGYTNDIKRRVAEHNQRQEWELVYFEAYKSETDARNRERRLKQYAQALTGLKERLRYSLT